MGFFATGNSSPYLKDGRLADVIAALTVLSAHRSSEKEIGGWCRELSKANDKDELKTAIAHWSRVFHEHPEFFVTYRLAESDEIKAALRLRYSNKSIDRETRQEAQNLAKMTVQDRSRLTSHPLPDGSVNNLVSAAINLHAAALSRNADARFWFQFAGPALGLLGGVLVAIISAALASPSKPSIPQTIVVKVVSADKPPSSLASKALP